MDKKIHRFLVQNIPEEESFSITEEKLVHQLVHVLRIEEGENIILFKDGGPDVLVTILSVSKKEVVVKVVSKNENGSSAPRKLIVLASVIRRERFEVLVEKLTELGVSEIVPIHSHRTVRQSARIDRLQAISDEALEQCGGNKRVLIHGLIDLNDALVKYDFPSVILSQDGKDDIGLSNTMCMYVGPEGGWSKEDLELFNRTEMQKLTLGNRVLRTETAGIIGAHKILWK